MNELKFTNFCRQIANLSTFPTNITASGTETVQQTVRNQWRTQGVSALVEDLKQMYGDELDILVTKDGIVFVIENEVTNHTISWELKNTIKALDYDPFEAANLYDDEVASKAEKAKARQAAAMAKAALMAEKRAKVISRLARRNQGADAGNED